MGSTHKLVDLLRYLSRDAVSSQVSYFHFLSFKNDDCWRNAGLFRRYISDWVVSHATKMPNARPAVH